MKDIHIENAETGDISYANIPDGKKYKIIDNYGNCIKIEEIESFLTSYFDIYDYICGDYAYDRLRLKGFCDKENKNLNKINDIKGYEKYISDLCSYKCKHFLLKKEKTK